MTGSEHVCGGCGTAQLADAAWCDHCGAPLAHACPACARTNRTAARYCRHCGGPLTAGEGPVEAVASRGAGAARREAPDAVPSPARLAAPGALEGERKQVTVLFADIKGSMELLAGRDPEEARGVLDPVLESMMEAVRHYGGTVNQVMGDGVMALFGAPVAQEDHAVRACLAALRMRDAIARLGRERPEWRGQPVAVRIGLNSGEVVVRAIGSDLDLDYTAVGQSTHLAARMEQMAEPGSILATASTVGLVAAHVETVALGPMSVKGIAVPVDVFEITRPAAARSRVRAAIPRGPFVNRTRELDRLRAAWERARGGRGHVVSIIGEAGRGKSRLVRELLGTLAAGEATILVSDRASHDQLVSWGAVTEVLRQAFGADAGEAPDEVAVRVDRALAAMAPGVIESRPALLTLLEALPAGDPFLALDPSIRRERTREAIVRVLFEASRARPLVLVVENVQWLDSESRVLVDQLMGAVAGHAVLLVLTSRAELEPASGGRAEGHGSATGAPGAAPEELRLEPLAPGAAHELLAALLGSDDHLRGVARLLVERTEGNPFFIEESVRALAETGALTGEPGAYRLDHPLEAIALPPTVQAMLASRIDRLAPADKQLLQCAAVVGQDVTFAVLRSLTELPEGQLREGLARLGGAGFVQAVRFYPELEYRFAQALTHEVAYRSLLAARRRALHERVVAALEASGPSTAEQVERLAHHAFRAELWPRAVELSVAAGGRAAARAANAEAVAFLEHALAALEHLPEDADTRRTAIDVRLALRPPLLQLGRLDDVLTRSEEAERLAQSLDDTVRLARVYTYLINYHYLRGDLGQALAYGERCLEIADDSGDEDLAIAAGRYLGQIHHVQGDYRTAREVLGRAHERLAARAAAGGEPRTIDVVSCEAWLAFTLTDLGEFEGARGWIERARAAADAAPQPYPQAIAGTFDGLVRLRQGDSTRAAEILTDVLAGCREHDLAVWQPIPSSVLGLALARLGRKDEALTLLRRGVELTERLGVQAYLALWTHHLADGLLALGEPAPAREIAVRALELARLRGERGHEAAALRLLGEITARGRPGDVAGARGLLSQALELSASLKMRPVQAACQLALTRLALRAGDRRQAVTHLAEALVLFGEMEVVWPLREAREELRRLGRMFIVARHRASLYSLLRETFVEDASVAVILDRREGDRREPGSVEATDRTAPSGGRRRKASRGPRDPGAGAAERRTSADRRQQADIETSLRERGLAIVV